MPQKIKIAINGFGRIGRTAFQAALENKNLEVVAINDLTDTKTLAHLLKYDTVYRTYNKKVGFTKDALIVAGKKYKVLAQKEPNKLPWKKMGIDVVLECTGRFTDRKSANLHLKAGANRVVISAPAKEENTKTLILGVNENEFNPKKDKIIANGSCTTNCLVPVFKVLNDEFGVEKAVMSTIHSYTNTQSLVDGPHKNLREARAAAQNIIPTDTGATKAIVAVYPEMKGKIEGMAFRVPSIDVSVLDLTVKTVKEATVSKVNQAFKKYANGKMKNILAVSEEPLVSSDYIKNPHSAIVDLPLTLVEDGNLVKVVAWYDNEWGYSCRLVEMAEWVGRG